MTDMSINIPIVLGLAAIIMIAVILYVCIRRRLQAIVKDKNESITEELYGYDAGKRQLENEINGRTKSHDDINDFVEGKFAGSFITHENEREIKDFFYPLYEELSSLLKRMNIFSITDEKITDFIYQYEQISNLVKNHNAQQEDRNIKATKDFFDHILKYPLDLQQRKAIISEEDNCLVVSSAGSGKTSSIVGKVKYLTEIKHVDPKKILLISYTNKAAAELTDRMDIQGLRGYTFHKLALDIIAREQKAKPSICDNTDSLFVSIFHQLLEDEKFKQAILVYFIDYQVQESDEEKRLKQKRQKLASMKDNRIKAVLPDMDGKPIYVRSEEEKKLCFVLSSLGLKFRYEEAYEHQVLDEYHSQYRPDFSIHYEKNGIQKRLYLENFGVDEHGMVPMWFAESKGISYEECNQRYGDGITWKRELHRKFGTTLIETSSADFHYFDIAEKVKKLLKKEGVPVGESTYFL